MAEKKYLTLSGKMDRTPYGIGLKVFISKELLEKVLSQEPKQWDKEEGEATPQKHFVLLERAAPDAKVNEVEERLEYWKKMNPRARYDLENRAFILEGRGLQ